MIDLPTKIILNNFVVFAFLLFCADEVVIFSAELISCWGYAVALQ